MEDGASWSLLKKGKSEKFIWLFYGHGNEMVLSDLWLMLHIFDNFLKVLDCDLIIIDCVIMVIQWK